MNSRQQDVILGLLGLVALYVGLTDNYLRYVKDDLRPFLIAGGLFVLAIAISRATLLWFDPRFGRKGRSRFGKKAKAVAHETHTEGHETPKVAWLLVLPVVVLMVINPPALGAWAVEGRQASTEKPPAEGFSALPDADVISMPLFDFAGRAIWDETKSLHGRTVKLKGFTSTDANGSLYINRLAVSCCAADASATRIRIAGSNFNEADAWIEVTGTWNADTRTSPKQASTINASQVVQISKPSHTYERLSESPKPA